MVDGIHAARRGAERKLPITISRARLDASLIRMGGRAVDCARLESVCSLTGTQGSNPCPSENYATSRSSTSNSAASTLLNRRDENPPRRDSTVAPLNHQPSTRRCNRRSTTLSSRNRSPVPASLRTFGTRSRVPSKLRAAQPNRLPVPSAAPNRE